MIAIGKEYLYIGDHPEYKNKTVSVQDANILNQMARISIPDINEMCLDWTWVEWKDLKEIE